MSNHQAINWPLVLCHEDKYMHVNIREAFISFVGILEYAVDFCLQRAGRKEWEFFQISHLFNDGLYHATKSCS